MEFKGTKGKWLLSEHGKSVISSYGTVASCWGENVDDLDERLEGESWLSMRNRTFADREERLETIPKANALLISKAPEMLEMLKDIHSYLGSHFEKEKKEIEKLIKEATEL
jgi:hypothetical protein